MIIIFSILVLLMLFIVGIGVLKLSSLDKKIITNMNFIWISPLIGIMGSICIIQILNVVFAIRIVSIIYLILVITFGLYSRDLLFGCYKAMQKNKVILIIISFALIILNMPAILKNDFISIQKVNNDIIFYLSSMDWLLNHSLMEKVAFSKETPFYSCANYMVTQTRFGFDLFGSLIMAIFKLEAHEVFFVLSTICAILASLAFYFLTSFGLKVSSKISMIAFFLVIFSGNWANLISYGYAPQILGIASLAGFVSFLFVIYHNEYSKGTEIILALFIVGTISVYAEFASYMLVIFIFFAVIHYCINYKYGNKFSEIKYSIKAGFLSFLMNPVGMYIGYKFNLNILKQVSNSPSNIDAYHGKFMTVNSIITKIVSIPVEVINQYNRYILGKLLIVVLYTLLICILVIVAYRIFGKKDSIKYSIIGIMAFFALYWMYFRKVGLAYGEFKHITSITPFIIVFMMYFIDLWKIKGKFYYLLKIIFSIIVVISGVGGFIITNDYYKGCNYYDDDILELRNVINTNYSTDVMTVDANSYDGIHRIVYALKDKDVKLLKDHDSYFSMYQKFDDKKSDYRIKEIFSDGNMLGYSPLEEKIIWKNSKYAIVKRENMIQPIELINVMKGKYLINGESNEDERIIRNNGISYGPYIQLKKGNYKIRIEGNNLDLSTYDINTEKGKIEPKEISNTSNSIEYTFLIEQDINQIEFRIFNNQEKEISIKSIKIEYLK